jgi:hypothetical protein
MGRAWALALVATGCYQPAPADGVACSSLGDCPAGQRCVGGTCRPESFAEDAAAGDTSPRDDAAIDGAFDAAPLGAWAMAVEIPGVDSTATEGDPSLTADRLTICFTSNRGGNDDLFLGTRATTAAAFTVASIVAVNSTGRERSCELAADGSSLVFVSDRTGNFDVYLSIRQGGAYQPPAIVPELSSTATENDVAISPDGRTALLSRANDMYLATRAAPGDAFSMPALVPELDVTGNVAAPSLTNDAATVYLHAGATRDLYAATRIGTTFTTPVPITELNTAARDAAPFVSADDRTLVFERTGVLFESTR